jgi:DNA-binding NtrC family response regulator
MLTNFDEHYMKEKDIKVLLVDDEMDFANTLAQRLKMRNLKVGTAYDGEEALTRLKEDEPDVVVLDLNMPGMHGMEVLAKTRKAYPDIQVIILTGHGTDKEEEEAKKIGSCDFLNKPADIDYLEQKIRKAFRKKLESTATAAAFDKEEKLDALTKDKKTITKQTL